MGRHERHSGQTVLDQERLRRNRELNRLLHRSILAHLTRPVADPERPGETISYGELEQRLRGRAYRRAAHAAHQAPRP